MTTFARSQFISEHEPTTRRFERPVCISWVFVIDFGVALPAPSKIIGSLPRPVSLCL
jgi:hypothetical protein